MSRRSARRCSRRSYAGAKASRRESLAPYRAGNAHMEVWTNSFAREFLVSVQITCLPDLCGPRGEILALDDSGKPWRLSKETARLSGRKARESRRLEISGGAIGCLDDSKKLRRQRYWQSKTHMNGGQQAGLDGLVGVADHGLEWCDHVANYIFGGVVQQHGEAALAVEAGALVSDGLDQQRVLRDRIDVLALSLAVPACDAGEAVRDIRDLDIEWGGIEQVEASPGQHALPCTRCCALRVPAAAGHCGPASLAQAAWRWQVTR